MIQLSNISLAFDQRVLMKGVTAHFKRGEMVALLGRNGTGKSTLLRAMAKLGEVADGEIMVDGHNVADIDIRQFARFVAFVNTERVDVEALSAYDLVAIGRSPYTDWRGRLRKEDRAVIERSMQITGIEHLAQRMVETLSDGECQRVMIARALAQDTPVILLDEPTAFLDLPNRYELCMLLSRLAHDEGKLILFSTHELDIALSLADSIALVDTPHLVHMSTQAMIASGNLERLFNSKHIAFDASSRSIRLCKR